MRGGFGAHDFQQFHDVGGREEVQADHVSRAFGGGGYGIHVERRGVGGEDCAGFGFGIQCREDALLQLKVFKYGFDDQIGLNDVIEADRTLDQADALVGLGSGQTAFGARGAIVGGDGGEATLQRLVRRLDQGHGNASVGEAHGNAATHCASTDHGDAGDGAWLGARRHIGNLGRFPLSKEDVALCL